MKSLVFVGIGAVVMAVLLVPIVLHEAGRKWIVVPTEAPTVLFMGDIMFDRDVARHARVVGADALLAGLTSTFAAHDVVMGNLEGTITTNASVAEADNTVLRFTFAPLFAQALRDAGVTTVSLANNHALDFGEFGFEDTRHYLDENGIAAFGSPYNDHALATAAVVRDHMLCFVGYHELFESDPSAVVAKIQDVAPTCDRTIVFAHWGVEYEHQPSVSQQELAHLFVDSGADLVIGAHPHVVQPVEVYNNVAIFYSLGNFIFDQGWMPEVRRGTMVSVEFARNETRFTVLPVTTYLEAAPASDSVAADVLADLGLESATFTLHK